MNDAKIIPLQGAAWILRLELRNSRPLIYRSIVGPGRIGLPQLQMVIQAVMGWQARHLHELTINGVRYGELDPDYLDLCLQSEERTSPARALGTAEDFQSIYDFGDYWEHRHRVTERAMRISCRPHRTP